MPDAKYLSENMFLSVIKVNPDILPFLLYAFCLFEPKKILTLVVVVSSQLEAHVSKHGQCTGPGNVAKLAITQAHPHKIQKQNILGSVDRSPLVYPNINPTL